MRVPLTLRFLHDERGATLPLFGFMILVGIGIAALAIDMGYLYYMRGKVQTTADAAALAGAGQIPDLSNIREAAISLARQNLPENANGEVVTEDNITLGYWNSATRTFTALGTPSNAVRVTALRTAANENAVGLFFARVLGFDTADIDASAIVQRRDISGCIVALDPTADGALTISGNADVDLGCGAVVASSSPTSIIENGNSCLTATSIATAGDYSGDCLNPTPEISMPAITDPLADLDPPAPYNDPADCDHVGLVTVNSAATLTEGIYCGGIAITGSDDVEFEKGMYVVGGEGLRITGSGEVRGEDVTFYIPPTVTGYDPPGPSAPPRSLFIAGSTDVELRAPTSGAYEGILFYQDRNTPAGMDAVFTGASDMELEGLFYMPTADVKFAGNSATEGSDWVSIIARTVEFVGTSSLTQDLSEVAYSPAAAFVSLHIVD